ncbi:MAG TPA: RsmD family RNA methyltransferase [Alphaproteobacteria bacterium]|nr:RsmD family RNA methyltransferase [Alphaproteobacteria bacterium]
MRIVAGRHRGRRLLTPEDRAVRPSSDRLREAVFSILGASDWGPEGDPLPRGARVLDAFCGTGALGLEALSRGAVHAAFLDLSPASLDLARRNAAAMGEGAACAFLRGDAARPPPAGAPVDLAFLDPPYAKGLLPPALAGLRAAGWLRPGALAVAEFGAGEAPAWPEGFEELDRRRYGAAAVAFLRAG